MTRKRAKRAAQTLNIISNRLPVSVSRRRKELNFQPSTGGLATGLASLAGGDTRCRWLGWPGIADESLTRRQKTKVEQTLAEEDNVPIFLSRKDVKKYYQGFCNETIWPLFHYFQLYAKYDDDTWEAYVRVNETFCEKILSMCSPDETIWIHDYHLMLLPAMVRDRWPDAHIGFFLHIPFPSYEIFRLLPWRHEILRGLLGADLIGFHTFDYVRHFLSSVSRLQNIRHYMDTLDVDGRSVKVEALPMGIDYERFSNAAASEEVEKRARLIRKNVGERKVIVSIDRLDYTKGIIQRLEAYDAFLTQHPEYHENVTLILLAVPSRTSVGDYAELRKTLERLVGRVNGRHGTIGWVPVWYLYRSESFERLVGMYRIADVALVTPLRDGMNLIAKEFVASRPDGDGVLVLSEMAGAASELGEAITVNANDRQAIVDALKHALEMPLAEQQKRMRSMQARLSQQTVEHWAADFMASLSQVRVEGSRRAAAAITNGVRREILKQYRKGHRNLLIFDYDARIEQALRQQGSEDPRRRVRRCLESILARPDNEVVFISNLDRETLDGWLGDLDASLVAEHGAWIREKRGGWQMIEPLRNDWKATIRPILEMYTSRTPESRVEERDYSLIWSYGAADWGPAFHRKQELLETISNFTEHLSIEVVETRDTIEIINAGVRKSQVARMWIGRHRWDFIMGISGDAPGDDLFRGFPDDAYSIRLGRGHSSARIQVESGADLLALLESVAQR